MISRDLTQFVTENWLQRGTHRFRHSLCKQIAAERGRNGFQLTDTKHEVMLMDIGYKLKELKTAPEFNQFLSQVLIE